MCLAHKHVVVVGGAGEPHSAGATAVREEVVAAATGDRECNISGQGALSRRCPAVQVSAGQHPQPEPPSEPDRGDPSGPCLRESCCRAHGLCRWPWSGILPPRCHNPPQFSTLPGAPPAVSGWLCRLEKEAEGNRAKLTDAFLELKFIEALGNNTKIFFGTQVRHSAAPKAAHHTLSVTPTWG